LNEFDVAIVGGGLVGLSLARALQGSGLRLALVDREPPAGAADVDPSGWDSRVYAISPASETWLERLGTWPAQADRIAPVYEMVVRGDAPPGRVRFSAYEAHVAHLASIVENRLLLRALHQALASGDGLTVFSGERGVEVSWGVAGAQLTLAGGTTIEARLLVGADGGDSWLRAQAGIDASMQAYDQTAVVANFACARPHHGTAHQWFRDDGVLALLPLPGERVSMVWSAREDLAQALLAMSAGELCARVEQASQSAVGTLDLITPAAGFALRLIRVAQLVRPRLALVGDAAHNLHPLAGQGVNLGFQDAQQLAEVLLARGACRDVGELRLLRRYERARREDILAMTLATDGLQRLFSFPARPLSLVRNVGLALVDRAPLLKQALVRHALGG
jgi:ubiquinone biosynthesis UbiH/UbiF/VisC/COQ6 family hydroxylase